MRLCGKELRILAVVIFFQAEDGIREVAVTGVQTCALPISGRADGPGNLVMLVGADTGRDGIGGANVLASRVFDESSAELRPTVQVGNPFLEKLLMEACLEIAEKHPDWVVGIQDLGAAGLPSSS